MQKRKYNKWTFRYLSSSTITIMENWPVVYTSMNDFFISFHFCRKTHLNIDQSNFFMKMTIKTFGLQSMKI